MIAIILKTKKPLNGFFFYSEYLVTFLREYLAINSDPKIITTHVIVQMMNNNPYEVASMMIPPTNGPIALPIAAQALVNPWYLPFTSTGVNSLTNAGIEGITDASPNVRTIIEITNPV